MLKAGVMLLTFPYANKYDAPPEQCLSGGVSPILLLIFNLRFLHIVSKGGDGFCHVFGRNLLMVKVKLQFAGVEQNLNACLVLSVEGFGRVFDFLDTGRAC